MTKFNTTIGTVGDFGRFGNLFFRNICASIISKKNNLNNCKYIKNVFIMYCYNE